MSRRTTRMANEFKHHDVASVAFPRPKCIGVTGRDKCRLLTVARASRAAIHDARDEDFIPFFENIKKSSFMKC